MPWTAPDVDRTEPNGPAAERTALEGWLEYHRGTLLTKCAGLSGEQLATHSVEPSSLSLLGLVRHMTEVERSWFRRRFAGEPVEPMYYTEANPDADFDDLDAASAEADFAAYRAELDAVRQVASDRSLDETFVHPRTGSTLDLRWIYLHMIEEYARHNGHADLLRERIDGRTGD
ncbi:MAG TPA: DinB family protein [Mycobacteriales bacterium]|jgi:uncharacterized damage-inducible protein DinB|nr:DinB family protein [Mycobacteriales bacterium]